MPALVERRSAPRSDTLIKLLSQPLMLEECGPPKALTHLLWLIGGLVFGGILLLAFTTVSETALTRGQVVPAGSVNVVQHLEGGIVEAVLVEEGEIVDQGAPLMRLRRTAAQSDLDELRVREMALALRAERLRAFAEGREPDFSAGANFPELVDEQRAAFDAQDKARQSQKDVLQARIDQKDAHVALLQQNIESTKEQVAILKEVLTMRETLLKKGLVSRILYLDNKSALARTEGELASLSGQLTEGRAALAEAENSLAELETTLQREAQNSVEAVSGELAEVRERLNKHEDRVARLEITAPVRGIVKGITRRTLGAVVGAGEPLMEIVPLDDQLIAEVRIEPRDIGHVKVGQPARVNITAYDTARLGTVDGELRHVSASTFSDVDGGHFYKGRLELDKAYVGGNPDANPVLPGMVVEADIVTGERTLLTYMLKPLNRALDRSFNER
jgi:HlyD family secretion protein/adhesin transport system membrane fusion protein